MYWGMSANSPPLPNPFHIINALRYTRACTFKTIYVSASSPPLELLELIELIELKFPEFCHYWLYMHFLGSAQLQPQVCCPGILIENLQLTCLLEKYE